MAISRDLSSDIARNERAWAQLNAEQRATVRLVWRTQDWNICPHPDCPPWNCRVTNP